MTFHRNRGHGEKTVLFRGGVPMSNRTKYDPKFKRDAVLLAMRGDRSLAQVARDPSIFIPPICPPKVQVEA